MDNFLIFNLFLCFVLVVGNVVRSFLYLKIFVLWFNIYICIWFNIYICIVNYFIIDINFKIVSFGKVVVRFE